MMITLIITYVIQILFKQFDVKQKDEVNPKLIPQKHSNLTLMLVEQYSRNSQVRPISYFIVKIMLNMI